MATNHKSEILSETKCIVEELLKQPELAKKAIHDRNIIVKGLRAEIDHRVIAFDEIDTRFQELYTKFENTDNVNKVLNQVIKDNEQELKKRQELINARERDIKKKNEDLTNKDKKIEILERELKAYKDKEKNTLKAKIIKFSEYFPDWKGYIIRQLVTQNGIAVLLFLAIVVLILQTIFGWTAIINAIISTIKIFI